MVLLQTILGLALLALGRKLFWLLVGAVGFVAGLSLAGQLLRNYPEWLSLVVALAIGVAGGLLAIFLEQMAMGAVGFFGGGYLAMSAAAALHISVPPQFELLPFLLGGVLGVILVSLIVDWALILISSLMGAYLVHSVLVSQNLVSGTLSLIAFIGLVVAGIALQSPGMLRGGKSMYRRRNQG